MFAKFHGYIKSITGVIKYQNVPTFLGSTSKKSADVNTGVSCDLEISHKDV